MSLPICSFGSIQESFDPKGLKGSTFLMKKVALCNEALHYQFLSAHLTESDINKHSSSR